MVFSGMCGVGGLSGGLRFGMMGGGRIFRSGSELVAGIEVTKMILLVWIVVMVILAAVFFGKERWRHD